METKSKFINELTLRVYNKVAELLFVDFLINNNPLIEALGIATYINKNLNDYLST